MLDIIDITLWAKEFDIHSKPWLILGKGPSFSKIVNVNTTEHYTCSLNHVVRELPVTVAHIIDIDVVRDCEDILEKNCSYLVMPFRPHAQCRATGKTLVEYVSEIPVLRRMAQAKRLVWYNLSSSKAYGTSPVIDVKFFSAEAALNILATLGVRIVRSLGVDGGSSYSSSFKDLNDKTLLANGHQSFDKQFAGIARTIRKTGIFYAPLHIPAPIRVFVGTDHAQIAGVKLLEYSIKKYASMSVEVKPIDNIGIPEPRDPSNRSRTGFSFSRFHIPKLCGYKGKAIYMDADMQVFDDLSRLWNTPFEGADVLYSEQPSDKGRVPQYSVLLLNCGTLKWDVKEIVAGLDEGSYDYKDLMQRFCLVPEDKRRASLPYEWNSLEHFEEDRTRLIHFTDMPTQPWISNKNKHGKVWYDCLREAVVEGFITKEFLYSEVEQGHVSPELPRWIGIKDPKGFEKLKKAWIPPFRRFVKTAASTRS